MNETSANHSRIPLCAVAFLLPLCADRLHAQEVEEAQAAADIPTLEQVQALRPEEEILDLYLAKNPITVEPNRFDKAYDPGLSPEAIALEHGGYINYGINLGLQKSWQGIKKVTGMRAETQPAIARPPPLSEEQMRRAALVCAREEDACGSGN